MLGIKIGLCGIVISSLLPFYIAIFVAANDIAIPLSVIGDIGFISLLLSFAIFFVSTLVEEIK